MFFPFVVEEVFSPDSRLQLIVGRETVVMSACDAGLRLGDFWF